MGNVTNSYKGIHQFTMTQVLGLQVVIYNMTLAFQYEEFNNCLFAHHVYELLSVSLSHFSELEGQNGQGGEQTSTYSLHVVM